MALYSPGRRRAILLLLLTSVLLLTLDMRGSAILDGARSAWSGALRPFESAAEVVARPLRNAWRGITNYDALEDENRRLNELVEAQRANDLVARSTQGELSRLRALLGLEQASDYPLTHASVVGLFPSNLDQTIEIDAGRNDGLREGMPVLAGGGGFYVGRVLRTTPDRATVLLLTDNAFDVQVKIVRSDEELPTPEFVAITTTTTTTTTTTIPVDDSTPPGDAAPPPTTAAPLVVVEVPTTTTVPADPNADPTADPNADPSVDPGTESSDPLVETTTTTTIPSGSAERETGLMEGQGPGQYPRIRLVADTPGFGSPQVGDVVKTAGGTYGLAPADIPIGVVVEVIHRSAAEGVHLRVQPFANLNQLETVQVMLYQPATEAIGSAR